MSLIKHLTSVNGVTIRPLFFLLLIFAVTNALVLDILLLTGKLSQKQLVISQTTKQQSQTQNACPASCVSLIQATTSASKAQIATQTTPSSTTKEFYVPFGTGSDSKAYWDPVDSMQAYVDTGSYGRLKQVVFEVSLSLPQANEAVSVRLYNVSANHPVWNSDITMSSGQSSAFLVSQPITLGEGKNLYQVQMQTQLNTPATITQARLHIFTF